MFWAPKIASEAISQHQIQKKFSGGACPQTPLASLHTLTLPLGYLYQSSGPMLCLRPFALIIPLTPLVKEGEWEGGVGT